MAGREIGRDAPTLVGVPAGYDEMTVLEINGLLATASEDTRRPIRVRELATRRRPTILRSSSRLWSR
jgi:hypothetical protein